MSPEHRATFYEIATDTTWYGLTPEDVLLLNEIRTLRGKAPLEFAPRGASGPAVEGLTAHDGQVEGCAVCAEQGPHIVSAAPES